MYEIKSKKLVSSIKIVEFTNIAYNSTIVSIYLVLLLGAIAINANHGSIFGVFGVLVIGAMFFPNIRDKISFCIGGSDSELARLLNLNSKEKQREIYVLDMAKRLDRISNMHHIRNDQNTYNDFKQFINYLLENN